MEGVSSVVVDTTGRAVIRTPEGKRPPEEKMNEALEKVEKTSLKVRKIEKKKFDAAVAIVEVKLDGFG